MFVQYNPNPASVHRVGDCAVRAISKALNIPWETAYIKLAMNARGRGRNARRDSRGRYSSEGRYMMDAGDMVDQLRDMMDDAPDERTKMEFKRFIQKMEQM